MGFPVRVLMIEMSADVTYSILERNLPKADNRIGGGVISAVVLSLTELADTDRCQTDAGAASKPERQSIDHEQCHAAMSWEPETQIGN